MLSAEAFLCRTPIKATPKGIPVAEIFPPWCTFKVLYVSPSCTMVLIEDPSKVLVTDTGPKRSITLLLPLALMAYVSGVTALMLPVLVTITVSSANKSTGVVCGALTTTCPLAIPEKQLLQRWWRETQLWWHGACYGLTS